MTPDPYIRGQAAALAAAFVLMALQAPALGVLIVTTVTALIAGLIAFRYRGDLRAAGVAEVPAHRERLDQMVGGDLRAAVAIGLSAGVVALVLHGRRPDLGIAPVSAVILGVTGATILLSSLIDWYLILPRVGGLLGIRPCREPDTDFPRHPKTWRELTRWWYIHRIAADVVLRFGLAYAITFTVARHTSIPDGGGIVAGAAAGILAGYLGAVPKAVMEAGHAYLIVGTTVKRRDVRRESMTIGIRGRRLNIPGLTRPVVGEFRDREYVLDVALEAVQLAWADRREGADLPVDDDGGLLYERRPNKLKVKDIDASTPEPTEPFTGCKLRCSGINWYCIENPRCFEAK